MFDYISVEHTPPVNWEDDIIVKKKGIYILILIIVIIGFIFLIKGKFSKVSPKIENITNVTEEMLKNISYDYSLGEEGKFILNLKNNNNANLIGLKINVEFCQEEELLGNTVKNVYMLEANKDYSMGMFSYIIDEDLLNEENIKIKIETQEDTTYEVDNSKIEIITNEGNDILKLEAKNNSEKTAQIQVNVIFYKEGKAVCAREWNDIILKEQSKTQELTKTLDMFGYEIEYDSYKVFYNAVLISE